MCSLLACVTRCASLRYAALRSLSLSVDYRSTANYALQAVQPRTATLHPVATRGSSLGPSWLTIPPVRHERAHLRGPLSPFIDDSSGLPASGLSVMGFGMLRLDCGKGGATLGMEPVVYPLLDRAWPRPTATQVAAKA